MEAVLALAPASGLNVAACAALGVPRLGCRAPAFILTAPVGTDQAQSHADGQSRSAR